MRQSTVHCLKRLVFAALLAGMAGQDAVAVTLQSWKDELFAYGTVVETTDDGALKVVDYQEMRDINGRDQVPERRVKSTYVSTAVKKAQQNATVDTPAGPVDVAMTGKGEGRPSRSSSSTAAAATDALAATTGVSVAISTG